MPFQKFILSAVVTVWGLAIGAGLIWVTDYSSRPNYRASAPASLPLEVFKYRKNSLPTLLAFLHPHCPCSRATLAELARLVAQNQNRANIHALFYQPLDKPREWAESDLWHQAARVPEINVARISELDLHRFGVTTSGQALLYDTAGRLVFSGGITRARGHEGDNLGRTAISEFLRGNQLLTSQTPVFGCSIIDAE